MTHKTLSAGKQGLKGFDTNTVLTPKILAAAKSQGFSFVLRYVGRQKRAINDIGENELNLILSSGLASMPVQHVEPGEWIPSFSKGMAYGICAAAFAAEAGYVPGTTVWLDLESIDKAVPAAVISGYCNAWHTKVAEAGFLPGIYVGWQAGLTAKELYTKLRFTRYWAAYNLNQDQFPETCGVCLEQSSHARILGVDIDSNELKPDLLGRLPTFTAPDEWGIL